MACFRGICIDFIARLPDHVVKGGSGLHSGLMLLLTFQE